MGICEYGPDVLFGRLTNIFSGLADYCVGECSEDIEAGFSLSISVISVWDERHAFVMRHSVCGGRVGVGFGCVLECYCGLKIVFVGPGCYKRECRF